MKRLHFIPFLMLILISACEKDPCDGVTCKNGGASRASGSNCTCTCLAGYEGELCEIESRAKIIGLYDITGTWSSTDGSSGNITDVGVANITVSTSFNDRVNILYPCCMSAGCSGGVGIPQSTFYASVDGSTITVPNQPYANVFTIIGNGTINASSSNVAINLTLNLPNLEPTPGCHTTFSAVFTKR